MNDVEAARTRSSAHEEIVMMLYADAPARRAFQVLADVLAVAWAVFWIWAARRLHAAVTSLAEPGVVLENAGNDLNERVLGAADAVEGLPVVGDQLRGPFEVVAEAGTAIAGAGQRQQDVVANLALGLSGLLLALALAVVLLAWLPRRIAWVRRAAAARSLLATGASPSLFALRALATRPLADLRRISPDPAGAWQHGDRPVIEALAGLELAALGLRPPQLERSPAPPPGRANPPAVR